MTGQSGAITPKMGGVLMPKIDIIQLAMWLMADPEVRIVEAWRNKAVRYNLLNKDFKPRPQWYRNIVEGCVDWRNGGL